ncbi:unnamed protein product [Sphagnum troendelagicum]|uniref:Uncharacterized protein n=1 Tax=Sphagnum troendelagicum TaxID=128251 RepID=A0ABP0V1L4_9BRYO
MAPEVIRHTGHNWQANSVGCTVIEMATGKPPWRQQFQEREPTLRPSATELLKHPFVLTCENQGGLDDSEDIQQQAAADGHLQQQQANRGNTELRSLKGTWRQLGQDSWKPTGVLGKGSSFSFRGSPYSVKNSDNINWASGRVGNSDMDDLNCSMRLDSVRLDSIQHDTWNESYNSVSEPSFVDGGFI